jgi:hypothetical protein
MDSEKICDLCRKESDALSKPSSVLDDIPDLEKMCQNCVDRLTEKLTEARKYAHQFIRNTMVEEADAIRKKFTN